MRQIRILTVLLTIFFGSSATFAQTITREDFLSVIPLLEKEDFKRGFEATKTLLEKDKDESSELRPIITYMNIFCGAGMVSKDEMSREKFEEYVQQFGGKRVMLPIHPCIDSNAHSYNAVQLLLKNGSWEGFVTNTNKAATTILSFDYIKFADPIDPADFLGKNVRCGGTLKSVKVAEGKIVICRLYIEDAFIKATEPR